MGFHESRFTRRVSLILLFSLLMELVSPAFARPSLSDGPHYPRARQRRGGTAHRPVDPHLRSVLANALPHVAAPDSGVRPDLLPGGAVDVDEDGATDEANVEPEVSPTPVSSETPAAGGPKDEISPEPAGEEEEPAAGKPELAVLLADPRVPYPHYDVARQTHPTGNYLKPQVIHSAYECFINDYVTHVTERYDNLADEETVTWKFKSPNPNNNRTADNEAAAAMQWKYRAVGSSAADFKARYRLEIRVWDRTHPHGHMVFSREEPTKLCFLKPHCAIAFRDVGVWEMHVIRNGQDAGMKMFHVEEPSEAEHNGFSRRFDQRWAELDGGAAFTSDDYLNYQQHYAPPAPDRRGRQESCVEWIFQSPVDADTHRSTKFKLTQHYVSNGQRSTVTRRIYDSLYPKGHTYQTDSVSGRLDELVMTGGPGLPTYGNWRFTEKIDGRTGLSQTVPVRKIIALVQLPAGNFYQDNGTIAYQIKVATFPQSWNPGDISWKLKLRNDNTDQVMAEYEGVFLAESGEQVRTAVQAWDGRDEQTGQKPPVGTHVEPQLEINLLESNAPELQTLRHSAEFQAGERQFQLNAAAAADEGELYYLANETGDAFTVDDDLFLYLDDDQEPVFADTDGVRTDVRPQFRARRGQRLRMIAVDTFGLCRSIDGPLYLYHPASGQRQKLRSFPFDDECRNWPAGYAFLDIAYTIAIPSSSASPTSLPRATLTADCFPNLLPPEREFINRNSLGLQYPTSECRPIDTRPNHAGRYTAQIDTVTDARGRDPYPFRYVPHCSPVKILLDQTNGHYSHRMVDLQVPTRGLPLVIGRTYISEKEPVGPNFGWAWDFEEKLVVVPGANQVILKGPDETECVFFKRNGEYQVGHPEQTEKLAQLDDRHYEVTFKNHTRHVFEVPASTPTDTGEAAFVAILKQKIDRNGNTNTYIWDETDTKLLKIQGPVAAQYIKLRWAGDSPRLVSAQDHTGRCVQYGYTRFEHPLARNGEDWLLTRIVQPGGTTYEHSYHPVLGERYYRLLSTRFNGNLQEKIGACDDEPGVFQEVAHHEKSMKFEKGVDDFGTHYTRLIRVGETTPENTPQVTKSFLDEFGRTVAQVDTQGHRTGIEYDAANNIVAVTDPEGHRTEMEYDRHNNLKQIRDALQRFTRLTYTTEDDLVEVVNAKGERTTMAYDARHNLVQTSDNVGHGTRATYSEFGQVLEVTNNVGNTWRLAYNELGFLQSKTAPPTSDGQPATTWQYTTDSLGRTTRKQDPTGRVWTFRYDVRNHMVEATVPAVQAKFRQEEQCQRSVRSSYDRNDLLLSTTALDGRKTRYEYDDCHQLTAVHQPGYPRPVRLVYDSFENLIRMTNAAGHATEYNYDSLNRVRELVYPNGDVETFEYDSRSNLVEWNRGGQTISYAYDALSRLTNLDSPDTDDFIAWTYDELDRVVRMDDNSGQTSYTYTNNDLIASVFRDGLGVSYHYDNNDRLAKVEDNQGDGTDYTYNERDELTSVTNDGQTVTYGYDLVGRLVHTGLPNGIQCSRSFDERNRLLYLNYQKGSEPVLTYKYGHNQLGQRIVEEKTSAQQCKLTRYCYNPRRELIASDRRVNGGCHVVTRYRYDLNHNRIAQNQTQYDHNAADQLLEFQGPQRSGTLSYNPQGQTTNFDNFEFRYNQNQQIKEANGNGISARYDYDGSGRRVAKEVNGTRSDYVLLGTEVIRTYENGSDRAKYLLGMGREAIYADGAWKYYLKDGLGSTAILTDESGNVAAAWDYSDYGETTQLAGDSGVYNPYLYTGQEYDAELGMYNLRARHYSPTLGRFLARDPIGYGGGSNLYGYCAGDPTNYSDPTGLFTDAIAVVSHTLTSAGLNLKARIGLIIVLDEVNFLLARLSVYAVYNDGRSDKWLWGRTYSDDVFEQTYYSNAVIDLPVQNPVVNYSDYCGAVALKVTLEGYYHNMAFTDAIIAPSQFTISLTPSKN